MARYRAAPEGFFRSRSAANRIGCRRRSRCALGDSNRILQRIGADDSATAIRRDRSKLSRLWACRVEFRGAFCGFAKLPGALERLTAELSANMRRKAFGRRTRAVAMTEYGNRQPENSVVLARGALTSCFRHRHHAFLRGARRESSPQVPHRREPAGHAPSRDAVSDSESFRCGAPRGRGRLSPQWLAFAREFAKIAP